MTGIPAIFGISLLYYDLKNTQVLILQRLDKLETNLKNLTDSHVELKANQVKLMANQSALVDNQENISGRLMRIEANQVEIKTNQNWIIDDNERFKSELKNLRSEQTVLEIKQQQHAKRLDKQEVDIEENSTRSIENSILLGNRASDATE